MLNFSRLLILVADGSNDWGQPSIDFPIGDHVNVSRCRSHTNASGVISTSHIVASHITKLLLSFRQILQFCFRDNPQGRIPPWKVTKTRPFLSTCYGDPSATEVPPCCEAATIKLTFSTTSVLLLLNMPLSLYRGTIFRLQKNPRRGYRPKIAGILFVCNEPEGKYYRSFHVYQHVTSFSNMRAQWLAERTNAVGFRTQNMFNVWAKTLEYSSKYTNILNPNVREDRPGVRWQLWQIVRFVLGSRKPQKSELTFSRTAVWTKLLIHGPALFGN